MKITILNTSILTCYGRFDYVPTDLEKARTLVQTNAGEVQSAVGHKSTADILTTLLGIDVPVNRVQYEQQVGEVALVFKLRGRPEEGKILTAEEIEAIGYDFGLIVRLP